MANLTSKVKAISRSAPNDNKIMRTKIRSKAKPKLK